MSIFPSDIASEVRDLINRKDTNFPTDNELFTFISRGQGKIRDEIAWVAPHAVAESYEFQRSSGVALYDFPVDYGGYILKAEDITETDEPEEIPIVHYRELEQDQDGETDRIGIQGNQFRLGPIPNLTDSANAIRVHYTRSPENVHGGTVGSATSTTVVFPSSPSAGVLHEYESAYVNHEIEITSGAAVGQRRKISEYAASSRVATVETAFNPAPSSTDTYELVVEIPRMNAARDALISYVSKSIMRKDEMPDNVDVRDYNTAISDMQKIMVSEGFHSSPEARGIFER